MSRKVADASISPFAGTTLSYLLGENYVYLTSSPSGLSESEITGLLLFCRLGSTLSGDCAPLSAVEMGLHLRLTVHYTRTSATYDALRRPVWIRFVFLSDHPLDFVVVDFTHFVKVLVHDVAERLHEQPCCFLVKFVVLAQHHQFLPDFRWPIRALQVFLLQNE